MSKRNQVESNRPIDPKKPAPSPRTTFNHDLAQAAFVAELCKSALAPLKQSGRAAAIIGPEQTTLLTVATAAEDCTTLAHTASVCQQYFSLKPGEIALANDPAAGGTGLQHFSLVIGCGLNQSAASTHLIVSRFTAPRAHWGPSNKIDEEGVKIPPMPIGGSQLNTDLLTAIGQHPLAPANFVNWVTQEAALLRQSALILNGWLKMFSDSLAQPAIKNYIEQSTYAFRQTMMRLPLGEAVEMMRLSDGSTIKLMMQLSETSLRFDFNGTDESASLGITEQMVFSVCLSTIAEVVGSDLPINSGAASHIQVSTPARSLLSGQGGLGTVRGQLEVVPALRSLILNAIAKLRRQSAAPTETHRHSLIFSFKNAGQPTHLSISLTATRATVASGAAPASAWTFHYNSLDVEQLEANHPIRLVRLAPLEVTLLESAEFVALSSGRTADVSDQFSVQHSKQQH